MNLIKTLSLITLLVLFGFSSNAQEITKMEYSAKLQNIVNKAPSLEDVKKGDVHLLFFENNQQVEVKFICCKLVHVPKRGEMPAPIECCKEVLGDIKAGLTLLSVKEGDRLFIEDIVAEFNGKEVKFSGIALKF